VLASWIWDNEKAVGHVKQHRFVLSKRVISRHYANWRAKISLKSQMQYLKLNSN